MGYIARATATIGSLLLLGATAAHAAPADPNVVKTLEQPDGPDLRAHIWGDEFIHGYETTAGYTVEFDRQDNEWKYAERKPDGTLRPSDVTARPQGGPAKAEDLRPTAAAFNEERADQGAPALGAPSLSAAAGWAGADTDILFLVVEFTDTGCTFTPAQMQGNMFGGQASGPGDLDDYFDEISYGDLEVVGSVVGNQAGTDCIGLANTRAYYNDDNAGSADDNRDDDVVREAVTAADAYVDFADFDNDNDGTVDALGIIYAGGGPHDGCSGDNGASGGGGDNLWPHSGKVNSGGALTADGKTITPFIINSETTYALTATSNCNQMQTIGLFAHELGHSLGLPDLYDTDVGNGGVHKWTTMASQYVSTTNNADTPPHYDPWSKAVQGWVTPTVHQPGDRFVEGITATTTGGEVHQFRDNPGGFNDGSLVNSNWTGGSGEYFLVENRQQAKFDQGLSGCGLLVWHIDESQAGNQNGGHTAGTHRLVDIDEADGLAELDANGAADAGDPFPGSTNNRLWADTTNPNSKLYDATSTNIRMYLQSASCATTMNAAFGPNQAPVANAGGPYTTDEGTDVALTAAASSDADGDTLTYAWDLDNDGAFDDATGATPVFTNVGDNRVLTVKVRVTDTYGDSSTATTTVTVTNVRPTIPALTNDGPKAENTLVSIAGTVSDVGWEDGLTATVDWGDGTGTSALAGASENVRPNATLEFAADHTYGDDGTFTVTVCGTDDDGATTVPCRTTSVTVTTTGPTAAIDKSGGTSINGVTTILATAGVPLALSGRSTDPGSDDLTLTWNWGDGSPNTATAYLVNQPLTDPFPSPSIQPRDVTDTRSHTFTACVYDVGFKAVDDDGGASPTDLVKVLIVGNEDGGRQSGYWAHQYRQNGKIDFDNSTLDCYLQISAFMSTVFHERRNVSTFDAAQKVLFSSGNSVTKRDQLDRDLLTAWLNFANGAVGYTELVDPGGKGTAVLFRDAMQTAEAVSNNPAATPAQVDAQRSIISHINSKI